MSKPPCCPTCATPLEWDRKLGRYLACHESPEATALIRLGSKARRNARRIKELEAENRKLRADVEWLSREVKENDLLIGELALLTHYVPREEEDEYEVIAPAGVAG